MSIVEETYPLGAVMKRIGRYRRNEMVALCGPAILTLIIGIIVSSRHYLWRDELATVQFASLSVGDLFRAVQHVDLILSPYYLLMNVQAHVGMGGAGLRALSVAASSGTVALVTLLARRWWGVVPSVVAGLVLALNPLFVQLSASARPYALATFFTVLATIILDRLASHHWGGTMWIAYAASLVSAGLLQPFAVLVVLAHLVIVIGSTRSIWLRFAASVTAMAIAMAPLIIASQSQRGQVHWIPEATLVHALGILFNLVSYQVGSVTGTLGLLVAILFIIVVAAPLIIALRESEALSYSRSRGLRGYGFAVALYLGPWLALLAASLIFFPVLISHYLMPSTVGVALLFGAAANALARFLADKQRPRPVRAGIAAAALLVAAQLSLVAPSTVRFIVDPVWQDNFPGLVSDLQSRIATGDVIAIAQGYTQSGFATGIAFYTDDVNNESDILDRLPKGTQPRVDVRIVTSGSPLKTIQLRVPGKGAIWMVRLAGNPHPQFGKDELTTLGCRATSFKLVHRYSQDRLEKVICRR